MTKMHVSRSINPLDVLRAEHEAILNVLECLEIVGTKAVRTNSLDECSAREIVDFLRAYVDECHQGKEERALFPALGRKGLSADAGPVAVLLSEHVQSREEVAALGRALDRCEAGDASGIRRFAAHAEACIRLLRDHIAKEDDVLFPLAEGLLGDEDRADVVGECEAHELLDAHAGTHERFLEVAASLVTRLGAKPRSGPVAHVTG